MAASFEGTTVPARRSDSSPVVSLLDYSGRSVLPTDFRSHQYRLLAL